MTVTTTNNRNTYTTNGVTTTFPVTFKFRTSADLLVILVSATGVVSFPLLNTDFVVNIFVDETGELVFTPAPANAGTLHVIRRRAFVQSTSSIGKEEFSAAEVETIVDNLTFLIQDLADLQARSMTIQDYAIEGSGQFDARSNRIMNLEDPVNLQDAVTRSWFLANAIPGPSGPPGPGTTSEEIDDRVAALLVAGANITLTYNDAVNTLTIASAGGSGSSVTISDTAPVSPVAGNTWWNSADGNMYIYYNDGTSSQWVESTTAGSMTAAEILSLLLTVDGAGSGLDADLLDGNSSAAFVLKASPVLTGPALFSDGVVGAPSISFSSNPDSGIYIDANAMRYSWNGLNTIAYNGDWIIGSAANSPNAALSFNIDVGGDLKLLRDAANTLAQRNGVNTQKYRIYNTFTDAANYERIAFQFSGNAALISSEAAGTGVEKELTLNAGRVVLRGNDRYFMKSDGTLQWYMDLAGHFNVNTHNAFDIGAPATRLRSGYFGTSVVTPLVQVDTVTIGGVSTAPTAAPGTNNTQIATTAYADAAAAAIIAASDAMVFKGVIDCSLNPNYPAADRGWTYRVSVAGKIGGASGPNVETGDILLCLTDGTASGNHATVGAQWSIIQVNLDGAVISTRSVIAGAGLTGGGDLSADRTFDIGAGVGITVNANDVAITIHSQAEAEAGTDNTKVMTALRTAQAITAQVATLIANTKICVIDFNFDNGASAIAAGTKAWIYVPFACTINAHEFTADVATTAVLDVWVDVIANYPPTVADTITAADKPTLTAATRVGDTNLGTWTVAVAAGSYILVNVDSNNSATKLNFGLKVTKT